MISAMFYCLSLAALCVWVGGERERDFHLCGLVKDFDAQHYPLVRVLVCEIRNIETNRPPNEYGIHTNGFGGVNGRAQTQDAGHQKHALKWKGKG